MQSLHIYDKSVVEKWMAVEKIWQWLNVLQIIIICAWFEYIDPKRTAWTQTSSETLGMWLSMMIKWMMSERQSHCWQCKTKGANRFLHLEYNKNFSWNFCTIKIFYTFVRFSTILPTNFHQRPLQIFNN